MENLYKDNSNDKYIKITTIMRVAIIIVICLRVVFKKNISDVLLIGMISLFHDSLLEYKKTKRKNHIISCIAMMFLMVVIIIEMFEYYL